MKLFAASPDQSMQYFPPKEENGNMVVIPPDQIFEDGDELWKNAAVRPAGSNLFIIQFSNEEVRDRVIEEGPWYIQNKPLIVRKWEPGMMSLDLDLTRVPVWIHLRHVPLELFTKSGLSYIASAVGNPLYMDRITATHQRLSYAKVCVEIDVRAEILEFIEVRMRDGTVVSMLLKQRCGCQKKKEKIEAESGKVVIENNRDNDREEKKDTPKTSSKGKILVEKVMKADCSNCLGISLLGKASSVNKFAILEAITDVQEEQPKDAEKVNIVTKQPRATSAGVAELMKTIKEQKKVVAEKDEMKFYLSAIYGSNDGRINSKLWDHLVSLNDTLQGKPWALAGDFNIILEGLESSKSGQGQYETTDMRDFGEFVNKFSIYDHCFSGNFFTWSNKHQVDFLAKKLDRVMVNGNWEFSSTVEFLAPGVSNHYPVLIKLGSHVKSPPKPFKSFNFWTKHEEFLRVVEDSWKLPFSGTPMRVLHLKMKRLK
ncbi:hypothetical protein DITRI_Ditri04bG0205600 [Diplodiscus trichospermus]